MRSFVDGSIIVGYVRQHLLLYSECTTRNDAESATGDIDSVGMYRIRSGTSILHIFSIDEHQQNRACTPYGYILLI